jgi:hypothetical protein
MMGGAGRPDPHYSIIPTFQSSNESRRRQMMDGDYE